MEPERFKNSTSGRLVKVGGGDSAYWAFVPNPLPPSLPFDSELVLALSDAAQALGELSGLGRTMPDPNLLIGPFVRREAVSSSRIEGTQTDIAGLYAYEGGQAAGSSRKASEKDPDAREVFNYVRAMEYGLERMNELPVSLRLIRELHERLLEGVRRGHVTPGEFRRSQNWIGPPGCLLNDAHFVPPPTAEMKESLDAFEKYLYVGNENPPLVRLALIHYQFEAVHPFLDGNGRIGRLLIPLLLVHWGILSQPLLYLSAFFERHRSDYYDLLMGVSERGAWKEWVLFFLRGVTQQSRDAIVRAKRLQDLRAAWRAKLTEKRAPALLLRLVDVLFLSPEVSTSGAQRLLGVSYPTARGYVERLVREGILRQAHESAYGRTYVAAEILDVIGEDESGRE